MIALLLLLIAVSCHATGRRVHHQIFQNPKDSYMKSCGSSDHFLNVSSVTLYPLPARQAFDDY